MKIAVTGSAGRVGSVVVRAFDEHEVTTVDREDVDLASTDTATIPQIRDLILGCDVVFHCALNMESDPMLRENDKSGRIDPRNMRMEMNVFEACRMAEVPKLVAMSSVQADHFEDYEGDELISVGWQNRPMNPYGGHKILLEEIGRFYADMYGLEFVAMRLGGVTKDNSVKTYDKEPAVWLSHNDLMNVARAVAGAPLTSGRSSVFYVVSANESRIHDVTNPFGWEPHDNSADHMQYG